MPIDWTPEDYWSPGERAEYKAAARRVIAFHFERYKDKPKVEETIPEPPAPILRADPEPLSVTPKATSKEPRYPKGAMRVSYGLNAKARQAKEESPSGTK